VFSASSSRSRLASLASIPPIRSPLVERGAAEAFLAAQVRNAHAGVILPDEPDDLLVGVPALAHRASSRLRGFCSIRVVPAVGGQVREYPIYYPSKFLAANSLFGRSGGAGLEAACTNPANLAGGSGTLHPYLPTDGKTLPILPPSSAPDWGVPVSTPFVAMPDFLSAECAEHDGFHYLAITVHGDPSDPRIDDIGGDLTPEWGLHLVDANESMGDLVTITKSQAKAFGKKNKKKSAPAPMPY